MFLLHLFINHHLLSSLVTVIILCTYIPRKQSIRVYSQYGADDQRIQDPYFYDYCTLKGNIMGINSSRVSTDDSWDMQS